MSNAMFQLGKLASAEQDAMAWMAGLIGAGVGGLGGYMLTPDDESASAWRPWRNALTGALALGIPAASMAYTYAKDMRFNDTIPYDKRVQSNSDTGRIKEQIHNDVRKFKAKPEKSEYRKLIEFFDKRQKKIRTREERALWDASEPGRLRLLQEAQNRELRQRSGN